MELKITQARDIWIDEFKSGWDNQIKALTLEKERKKQALYEDESKKINEICIKRDNMIEEINNKYDDDKRDIQLNTELMHSSIDIEYENKLNLFVSSNLESPTMYGSLYTYVSDTVASWVTSKSVSASE